MERDMRFFYIPLALLLAMGTAAADDDAAG
jgi:hypothetical protein